jgi:hypothetical protein
MATERACEPPWGARNAERSRRAFLSIASTPFPGLDHGQACAVLRPIRGRQNAGRKRLPACRGGVIHNELVEDWPQVRQRPALSRVAGPAGGPTQRSGHVCPRAEIIFPHGSATTGIAFVAFLLGTAHNSPWHSHADRTTQLSAILAPTAPTNCTRTAVGSGPQVTILAPPVGGGRTSPTMRSSRFSPSTTGRTRLFGVSRPLRLVLRRAVANRFFCLSAPF